ncbi:MAG: PTS sugar transporter subunit IIC [Thermodesulfobacteriota bacterium]
MALDALGVHWYILFSTVFFAVFSLFRFSVNIGFVERPVVQGGLWGMVIGQPELGLKVGFFFELLWLDLFPAGTFIPPQAVFSVFASLVLGKILMATQPDQIFILMLCTIPLAFLGSWLEGRQREWQNKSYNLLLRWAARKQSHTPPQKMVAASIRQQMILNMVFGLSSLYFLYFCGLRLLPFIPDTNYFTWPMAWLMAGVGGIMALRVRKAYAFFFLGLAGVAAFMLIEWLNFLPV